MSRNRLYKLFWETAYCIGLTPWDTGEPPKQLQILVERGYITPCRVVDIGCGTGTSSIYLSKHGFEAVGIDISGEAIKKAMLKAWKEDAKCRFIIGDITDYKEVVSHNLGRFDLALDIGCLHSIIPSKRRHLYRRTLDILLKRGGTLLLWSFTRGFPGPPGLSPEDVTNLFRDGYVIELSIRFWWQIRWARFYIIKRIRA